MLKNLNLVEKFCVILFFFIAVFCIYICASEVFKFFVFETNVSKFKDAMTFSLSASSLFLALLLYSDWREKYVAESIDKDLREINSLSNQMKFIINQFPRSDSDIDKEHRRKFFEIYWNLISLNTNLKFNSGIGVESDLEVYINKSHALLNKILTSTTYIDTPSIENESKTLYDNLCKVVNNTRKINLNI